MTATNYSCIIIADDFTGACDTGLQFVRAAGDDSAAMATPPDANRRGSVVKRRFSAAVVSDPSSLFALPPVDVVVCNTETRNRDPAEARRLVTATCRRLTGLPHSLCYKKLDSTIRGNLAAEIDAVMAAFGYDTAIVSPALPAAGRTTVHGQHLLDGVPVHLTELAAEPGSPVHDSQLPRLLVATPLSSPPYEVRHVDIEQVSRGPTALTRLLTTPRERRTVFVCDAASDENLRHIAAAAATLDRRPLLCGSAGLAQFVPEAFSLQPAMPSTPALRPGPGPVIVVVGSAQSLSRRQTDRLLARGGAREFRVNSAPLEAALAHLTSTPDAVAVLSMADTADPESALRHLADVARGLANSVRELAGLAVTGGATAMELLTALEAGGVEIVEAIAHAVPVCRIVGGPFEGMPLVTKAGALGDEDVFVRAVARLTNPAKGEANGS